MVMMLYLHNWAMQTSKSLLTPFMWSMPTGRAAFFFFLLQATSLFGVRYTDQFRD